jgi:hypothetical protein
MPTAVELDYQPRGLRSLRPMADSSLTLADLERWELFGATWRVVELSDDRALLDMCACTGQLVERRESDDRALIDYVRGAAETGI